MTNPREGRAPGASGPQAEPPAEGAASHLGRQRWSHSGRYVQAGKGRQSGEGESGVSQRVPIEPARGEQLQVDTPTQATTPEQEQHGVGGCTGLGGQGGPRREGPC